MQWSRNFKMLQFGQFKFEKEKDIISSLSLFSIHLLLHFDYFVPLKYDVGSILIT